MGSIDDLIAAAVKEERERNNCPDCHYGIQRILEPHHGELRRIPVACPTCRGTGRAALSEKEPDDADKG